MLRKIGKTCSNIVLALSLSVLFWFLLLTGLPDPLATVQGIAAPTISKKEALSLMSYHGIKIAYIKDGVWVFERNGKIIPPIRRK